MSRSHLLCSVTHLAPPLPQGSPPFSEFNYHLSALLKRGHHACTGGVSEVWSVLEVGNLQPGGMFWYYNEAKFLHRCYGNSCDPSFLTMAMQLSPTAPARPRYRTIAQHSLYCTAQAPKNSTALPAPHGSVLRRTALHCLHHSGQCSGEQHCTACTTRVSAQENSTALPVPHSSAFRSLCTCGGLTLAKCQVPTKSLYHFPPFPLFFSIGQRRERT